ncbi:hypothetical protein CYMTET_14053 [Cymbomonas tetramitiformis]|uniref:Uncharacterized protein n=1 Tax=Cymbomonas tetramitiformis TaxID=36881 RepID=A0AAE0F2W3_9CHLO|nr:hypothetical protein CYMTET_41185 [Cymbomonas tetramitiformis]KAK3277978.1 hypothetical protein CYMTET_14053 [Cymbomonas tetramitiformis]
MVATRLTSGVTSRRRSLATIFDSSAARNTVTPPTPAPAGAPAASSSQAVFLAGVRTLTRERFDDNVAKHIIRKCFREKHERFSGTETNAQGTSDLLGVRFKAYTDPSDSISDFNAALKSARRMNTLDGDEVGTDTALSAAAVATEHRLRRVSAVRPHGDHLGREAAAKSADGESERQGVHTAG